MRKALVHVWSLAEPLQDTQDKGIDTTDYNTLLY